MPRIHLSLEQRTDRVHELLSKLDLLRHYGAERCGALMALTDHKTANPHATLRDAGLPFAAGATQRQISNYVATYLNEPTRSYDREIFRDYVLLPLREVGILEQLYVRPKRDLVGDPLPPLFERGYWVPKSPTSSYVLTLEAERLLLCTSDEDWTDALGDFVVATPTRRQRITQQRARTMLSGSSTGTKHGLLIDAACTTLLAAPRFSDFKLIFKDDGDDDRIKEPWASELERLGLTLDLSTRYPDGILADEERRELWIVDAVTSDGEVDTVRLEEISRWATKHGWSLVGATTAYADYQTFAKRQALTQNIAVQTTVWIAEDGGKLFEAQTLA